MIAGPPESATYLGQIPAGGKALLRRLRAKTRQGQVFTSIKSLSIRLLSLVGKFLLSLYMAKFTSLEDLGTYGIAFAGTMISVALFGFRLDYALMRDIAASGREKGSRDLNAATFLYVASYLIALVPFFWLIAELAPELPWQTSVVIFLLCCAESFANLLYNVTIALGRVELANSLFFLRAGFWTAPAILLGLAIPSLRNASFVLDCWLAASVCTILLNLYLIRGIVTWRLHLRLSAEQKAWIGEAVRRSSGVWLGTIAYAAGSYMDRFLVAHFLTLADVGVATFYLSFTVAMSTLVQSATFVPQQARMVELFDSGDHGSYIRLTRRTLISSFLLAVAVALGLAVVVYFGAALIGKPELTRRLPVFWLILVGAVIRTTADCMYYRLFVEQRTRIIWISDIVFCASVIVLTAILLQQFGLMGLGIASLLSACIIFTTRSIAISSSKVAPSPG
jgi:O-antigen/teichoic acid export membrane protein